MKKKRRLKPGEIIGIIGGIAVVAALLGYAFWKQAKGTNDWLDYPASLEQVAVVVNSNPLTLRDMAFYIAYDEQTVEEQALLYDEEDSTRYWNLYINHDGFVRNTAKKATMEKAVHDEIFYRMALEKNVKIEPEDEERVESVRKMFWNSIMFGDKRERLGVTEEELNRAIDKVAVVQKYQKEYAKEKKTFFADYDSTGEKYLAMREENEIAVNDEVWDRVHYGDVSLYHENGIFQEKKEKGE